MCCLAPVLHVVPVSVRGVLVLSSLPVVLSPVLRTGASTLTLPLPLLLPGLLLSLHAGGEHVLHPLPLLPVHAPDGLHEPPGGPGLPPHTGGVTECLVGAAQLEAVGQLRHCRQPGEGHLQAAIREEWRVDFTDFTSLHYTPVNIIFHILPLSWDHLPNGPQLQRELPNFQEHQDFVLENIMSKK